MTSGEDPFRVRVVVTDDHAIVRAGLRAAIEAPGALAGVTASVVAEAADGLAAIAAVKRHQPDLLLLDVAMPHAGGIEMLVEVRRWRARRRKVVVWVIGGLLRVRRRPVRRFVMTRSDGDPPGGRRGSTPHSGAG